MKMTLRVSGAIGIAVLWVGVAIADCYISRVIYRAEYDHKMRSALAFVLFSLPSAYFVLWLITRRVWRRCVGAPSGGRCS